MNKVILTFQYVCDVIKFDGFVEALLSPTEQL